MIDDMVLFAIQMIGSKINQAFDIDERRISAGDGKKG